MDFDQFTHSFSTNAKFIDNKDAKFIYENIIWKDENRINMVDLCNAGITPLTACALEIESYCTSTDNCTVNLNDNLTKQTIGRMIADALLPLGYTAYKSGRVNHKEVQFFKNASHFKKDDSITSKEAVVKTLVTL